MKTTQKTRTNARNWVSPEVSLDLSEDLAFHTPEQRADGLYVAAANHDDASDLAVRVQDWHLAEHHRIEALVAREEATRLIARNSPTNRALALI